MLESVGGGSELVALKAAFLEIRTTRRAFDGSLILPFCIIWKPTPLPELIYGGLNIPWPACGGDYNNAVTLALVSLSVAGVYLLLRGLLTDVIWFMRKIFIGCCWSFEGFMPALPLGSS